MNTAKSHYVHNEIIVNIGYLINVSRDVSHKLIHWFETAKRQLRIYRHWPQDQRRIWRQVYAAVHTRQWVQISYCTAFEWYKSSTIHHVWNSHNECMLIWIHVIMNCPILILDGGRFRRLTINTGFFIHISNLTVHGVIWSSPNVLNRMYLLRQSVNFSLHRKWWNQIMKL